MQNSGKLLTRKTRRAGKGTEGKYSFKTQGDTGETHEGNYQGQETGTTGGQDYQNKTGNEHQFKPGHRPPPPLQKAPHDRGLALRAYSRHHQVQFMLECDRRESIPIIARVESNLGFLQLVPIKY